jgi:hypothetical protein
VAPFWNLTDCVYPVFPDGEGGYLPDVIQFLKNGCRPEKFDSVPAPLRPVLRTAFSPIPTQRPLASVLLRRLQVWPGSVWPCHLSCFTCHQVSSVVTWALRTGVRQCSASPVSHLSPHLVARSRVPHPLRCRPCQSLSLLITSCHLWLPA